MKKLLKNKEFRLHPSGLWVSRDGEVFVPKNGTYPEHFTFGYPNTKGYMQVSRNRKIYKVHRLVAECFLDNPDNLPEVNHRDEDKTNNCVSNLEWCNRKYNNNYGTRNERAAKKRSKPVAQYSLDGELIKTWSSVHEVERALGFSNGNICQCCNGKRKTAYDFKWKYA